MTDDQLFDWAITQLRPHNGPFRIYPNPMRDDGVFIGQDVELESYEGVRSVHSGPIFASVPLSGYVLPAQVPREVADRLMAELHQGY